MSEKQFEQSITGITPDAVPNHVSDTELVTFLMGHIDAPCEVEVAPGQLENIRSFYIREAQRILPTLQNPFAKEMLEKKLEEFST